MDLFGSRKIRPAYTTAPTELPHADIEAQIADVDQAMREEGRDYVAIDALLDQRNAIRPARRREVPVVPGRAEASIRNYGENPW